MDAPLIRVEMEFADGTIRKLEGPPAAAWLEDVDNVVMAAHIRYGRTQIETYPWEETTKEKELEARDPFKNYEGTD